MSISELPNCYAKERLQELATSGDVKVWIVASYGSIGDWAAYIGFPNSLDEMKPEWRGEYEHYVRNVSSMDGTKDFGDKLAKETAKTIFPELVSLKYRS